VWVDAWLAVGVESEESEEEKLRRSHDILTRTSA
jgi:hypothetical protein